MGWYTEYFTSDLPTKIYHLCPKKDWEQRPNSATYYSQLYAKEKVIRCLHNPGKLMEVANCFYQKESAASEEWICLEVDTVCLRMNGIEVEMVQSDLDKDLQCPHVKDGIPQEAVTKTFQVQRDATSGEFLFVLALTDTCSGHGNKAKPETKITV